jgi:predicted metal-dependent peptidase
MTVSNLDRAKVSLVTQEPFWSSILLKRKLIVDKTIPTAAVDQRGQIYYNPDFIEKLSVDEITFLLAHEVGHVIGQHASRRGARNAKKWNYAGDAWINDMLREANIGKFIDGGVDMPGSKDETVDSIYNKLPDDNGSGKGPGNGPGGIGDDLIERGSPLTPEDMDRIDAEIRVEIAQAAMAAKSQGKLSGALAKLVADLIEVKTNWYDILERHMTALTKGDYSWARPNRRFVGAGHYLPSYGKIAQMGEVVIQVDVSGSISKQELDHYNGHLKRIIEQCSPERVHVLYTDTQVLRHETFELGAEFGLEFYSGGGTDMERGFEYLDTHGIEPEVFVCLTDGYTDFNVSSNPAYPVIWCISSEITAPYGETVHFELEN